MSEILKDKVPVVHVIISEDEDIVDELVSKISYINYRTGIRVLPPGVKGKGLLESVFKELMRPKDMPILLIEVNAHYSFSALQELLVKLKTWGMISVTFEV